MTERVYAARAALHMWEEPCISGKEGSGTVFFTGCPLGCVFCQNREIALGRRSVSQGSGASSSGGPVPADPPTGRPFSETPAGSRSRDENIGVPVTEEQLAETFLNLERQHANNINLVTPTHFVPQIIRSVRIAREQGLTVPIVYNTGSYETEETVSSLKGTVDIFLPDLLQSQDSLQKCFSNNKQQHVLQDFQNHHSLHLLPTYTYMQKDIQFLLIINMLDFLFLL